VGVCVLARHTGHDNDGDLTDMRRRGQLLEDSVSADGRESQIEHDPLRRILLDVVQRRIPVARFPYVESSERQSGAKHPPEVRIVRSWPRIERGLRRALDETVPFPPDLVLARFPHDAALRGALALAVDAATTDLLSTDAPALTGATQERQP